VLHDDCIPFLFCPELGIGTRNPAPLPDVAGAFYPNIGKGSDQLPSRSGEIPGPGAFMASR